MHEEARRMVDPRGTQRWRRLRKKLYMRDRMENAPCWICVFICKNVI